MQDRGKEKSNATPEAKPDKAGAPGLPPNLEEIPALSDLVVSRSGNAAAQEPVSRYQALQQGIREFEQRYPQFQAADYKPTSPEEVEAYNQYQSLKAVEPDAVTGEIMRRFLPQQEGSNRNADRILTSMGKLKASHDLKDLTGPKTYSSQAAKKKPRTSAPAIREVEIPRLWTDLANKGSITLDEAALYLRCSTKTVRRRADQYELKRSDKGRIVCNEQLRNQIRKVHGQHVLR